MKLAIEDNIARAMAKFIPELKQEYQEFVRQTLAKMKEDLGPGLPNVYRSHKWYRTFKGVLSLNIRRDYPEGYRYSGRPSEIDKYPYIIDEERLEKSSQEYAERVAYEWHHKMVAKLGDLDNVDIKYMKGGDLVITGNRDEIDIRIDQQRILKTSPYGTLFHQWPARIYVNGKLMSEREYKKKVLMMSLRAIDQEKKPKRIPIDPMTRPREFHFEYKADRRDLGHGSSTGEAQRDYAKGMNESEAWDKLQKREMRSGYYTRLYDPRIIKIYAWNGRPLPMPEEEQHGKAGMESESDIRGGVQRSGDVRIQRDVLKGKPGSGGGRSRHDKRPGEIHGVH